MTELDPRSTYSVSQPFYIVCTQSSATSRITKQTVFVKISGSPIAIPTTKSVIDLFINYLNANVKCVETERTKSVTYHSYQTNEFVMIQTIFSPYEGYIVYSADNDKTFFFEESEELRTLFVRLKIRDGFSERQLRFPAQFRQESLKQTFDTGNMLVIPSPNRDTPFEFTVNHKANFVIPDFVLKRHAPVSDCNLYIKSKSKYTKKVFSFDSDGYQFRTFFNIARPRVMIDVTAQPGYSSSPRSSRKAPTHTPASASPFQFGFPGTQPTTRPPVFTGRSTESPREQHSTPPQQTLRTPVFTGDPFTSPESFAPPAEHISYEKPDSPLSIPTLTLDNATVLNVVGERVTTLLDHNLLMVVPKQHNSTLQWTLESRQLGSNRVILASTSISARDFHHRIVKHNGIASIMIDTNIGRFIILSNGSAFGDYMHLQEINFIFKIYKSSLK
jgi:hypothetical protein